MMWSWLKRRFIPLFLLIIVALLLYHFNAIGRLIYPIHYKQDIAISAHNFDVDPLLIAAIIRTESNYRPDALSSKQAIGLMQVMPATAQWIIEQAGYSEQMMDHLFEPAVNIELGTWYVRWLLDRFKQVDHERDGRTDRDGQVDDERDLIATVAAAYNAGPNKVNEWLREGIWDGRHETSSDIPYGETRHYVKRVLHYYSKYKTFYHAKSIELYAADQTVVSLSIQSSTLQLFMRLNCIKS